MRSLLIIIISLNIHDIQCKVNRKVRIFPTPQIYLAIFFRKRWICIMEAKKKTIVHVISGHRQTFFCLSTFSTLLTLSPSIPTDCPFHSYTAVYELYMEIFYCAKTFDLLLYMFNNSVSPPTSCTQYKPGHLHTLV